MSIAASPELLQKMRDNKEVRNTAHPMDRLQLLKTFAERDYFPNTANLIEALLTIIDGMHTRICDLEEKLHPQSPPLPPAIQRLSAADADAQITAGITEANTLLQ
jgi:hypothetical protein